MAIVIRRAHAADACAIATIRVHSWRAAYADLLDPRLMAHLNIDHEAHVRRASWKARHADPRNVDLLASRDGAIAGWARVGPCRDDDAGASTRGELYALYALPEHWSCGVGHALISAAEDELRAAGYDRASLWVLEGNDRAARFYEQHGWREDGTLMLDERIVGATGATPPRERRRVRDLPLSA